MSASIAEGIRSREEKAAQQAHAAAVHLRSGDSPDLKAQIDFEDAIESAAFYHRLSETLSGIADDYEPFGRKARRSIITDLVRAKAGDKIAENRLASHRRAYATEHRDLVGTPVPTWLVQDAAPTSIASAPLLHMVGKPLPAGLSGTVNKVNYTTPPVAGPQAGHNAALPTPQSSTRRPGRA